MNARSAGCLLGAILAAVTLVACGGGDATNEGSGGTTVHGTVTLPGRHDSGSEWRTAEIERLLEVQEGVESARCVEASPGKFARRWTCTVGVEGQEGRITMRAQEDGHLSSTGNGIPGLKFG